MNETLPAIFCPYSIAPYPFLIICLHDVKILHNMQLKMLRFVSTYESFLLFFCYIYHSTLFFYSEIHILNALLYYIDIVALE